MILYPPVTENHFYLISRENTIDPKLFERFEPYEFLFLNRENKSIMRKFDEIM